MAFDWNHAVEATGKVFEAVSKAFKAIYEMLAVWREHKAPKQIASEDTPQAVDVGYYLRYRTITSRYENRKQGVITHSVCVEATRDGVTLYQGRYRDERRLKKFILKPSHLRMKPAGQSGKMQLFTVPFDPPLSKGNVFPLSFEFPWRERFREHAPQEYVTIACETKKLSFKICLPKNESITEAKGYEKVSSGAHDATREVDLNIDNNIISWEVEPKFNYYYMVCWKWGTGDETIIDR